MASATAKTSSTATTAVKQEISTTTAEAMKEPSPEVPIFLRKTYHMISTCDPDIACWSDDGETFVVKDLVVFERTIIPQFFKHSKFTSFVRQLNFYSFRKIKNADTIRIDPELEAATANYWRFRHEYFRKDKPDLLTKIKRMNGPKSGSTSGTGTTSSSAAAAAKVVSAVTSSSSGVASNANAQQLSPQPDGVASSISAIGSSGGSSSEVLTLKKRIEEMSKNINELTAMVNKVSLRQEEHEKILEPPAVPGTKRPKIYQQGEGEETKEEFVAMPLPDDRPDEMLSNMEIDDALGALEPLVPDPIISLPSPAVLSSRSSSNETDSDFVDQLFTTFQEEYGTEDPFRMDDGLLPPPIDIRPPQKEQDRDESNRPDPELMRRLGDALMLLPREIQEMIVDKLIAAITRTDFGVAPAPKEAMKVAKQGKAIQTEVPASPTTTTAVMTDFGIADDMPLAAATLAALLHQYNSHMSSGKTGPKNVSEKSIPVIPVHA